MKKLLLPALLLFFSTSYAQVDSVPKVPFMEVFTSSTCGPCRPGNIKIKELFIDDIDYYGKWVMIKYQMSWPGSGDPYYTDEAGWRRSFYGVNSVPAIFINGSGLGNPSQMNTDFYDDEVEKYSYLQITPKVTFSGNTVNYDVDFKALQYIEGPAFRIYMAVIEKHTEQNIKSNGEHEFEYVFKKMLPEAGEFVVADLPKDSTFNRTGSYTFQGNFRLPNNSNDQIDHSIEHSVEDFDNLDFLVWVQHIDRSILNAAWGYDENDPTHPHHPDNPQNPLSENYNPGTGGGASLEDLNVQSVRIQPNPASTEVLVRGLEQVELKLINVLGQEVKSSKNRMDIRDVENGVYLIHWNAGEQSGSERLIIRH